MAETQAFDFHVTEPEQRKGEGTLSLSYWVYKVRARANLDQYERKELEVLRRYSDFAWLRKQLSEEYPFCIVPPIPEKDVYGTLDKFKSTTDRRLLEYRQRALRKFLLRLGAHPRLYTSQLLKDFLELDEREWEHHMKNYRRAPPESHIAAAIEAGLSKQWYPTPSAADAGGSYTKALMDPPASAQVWEETKEYINRLEASLGMLRDRLSMLVQRRRDASNTLHEFGRCFLHVAEVEEHLEKSSLSNAIFAVSNHTEDMSKIYIDHADHETRNIVETLTYYVHMCHAVKETLGRTVSAMEARDKLIHAAESLRSDIDRLINKGGHADKVSRLECDLTAVKEKRDYAIKSVQDMETLFKDELRRFHHDKQFDVKHVLKSFAEVQMEYANKMKTSWESVAPAVENIKI